MTREEAILCIKGIKNLGHDMFTKQKDFQECLDMAIKALEQKTCEDAVSRKAVLNLARDLDFSKVKGLEHYKHRCIEIEDVEELASVTPDLSSLREINEALTKRVQYLENMERYATPVTPAISEIDKFNDSVNRATVLALINDVKNADGFKEYSQYEYLFDQVDKMPMAVPTRKKGKWIKVTETDFGIGYKCSECGRFILTESVDGRKLKDYPYCHCGAEMESEECADI